MTHDNVDIAISNCTIMAVNYQHCEEINNLAIIIIVFNKKLISLTDLGTPWLDSKKKIVGLFSVCGAPGLDFNYYR